MSNAPMLQTDDDAKAEIKRKGGGHWRGAGL
jgi:hypothetical protein